MTDVSWIDLPWTPLAAAAYATNLVIGTLSLRGRKVPRVWHGRIFLLALVLTAVAAVAAGEQPWRAAVLGIALVPLAFLPFMGRPVRRSPRTHIAIGLAAAPLYVAAVVLWAATL